MGRKYASFHIFDREQEKIISILKENYRGENSLQKKDIVMDNLFNSDIFNAFNGMDETKIIILQSESFISIYDESISFETAEEKAQYLSKLIDKPILYISNFDEDILIFGIYHNRERITSQTVGDGITIYEVEPKMLDIDIFCKELSLKKTNSMKIMNSSDDIEEIESKLEEIIRVPVKLTYDDVEEMQEYFIEVFDDLDIRILKII